MSNVGNSTDADKRFGWFVFKMFVFFCLVIYFLVIPMFSEKRERVETFISECEKTDLWVINDFAHGKPQQVFDCSGARKLL